MADLDSPFLLRLPETDRLSFRNLALIRPQLPSERQLELVESFAVDEKKSSREVSGELKKLVGLEPTPPPPTMEALAELSRAHAVRDDGDPQDVASSEQALAPIEFKRPRAPRTSLTLLMVLLVALLGVVAWVYLRHPGFFTGPPRGQHRQRLSWDAHALYADRLIDLEFDPGAARG